MNYWNIHINTFSSQEFCAASAEERGAWVSLMKHCLAIESAVIAGCLLWADRQWLKTCNVDRRELGIDDPSGAVRTATLWSWEGHNLHVWGFPGDKLNEIQAGREGGKKGGRPRKEQPADKPGQKPPPKPPEKPKREDKDKGKDKVMEGEGKAPATTAAAAVFEPEIPAETGVEPGDSGAEPDAEQKKGGSAAIDGRALAPPSAAASPQTAAAGAAALFSDPPDLVLYLAEAARHAKGNPDGFTVPAGFVRYWHGFRVSRGWLRANDMPVPNSLEERWQDCLTMARDFQREGRLKAFESSAVAPGEKKKGGAAEPDFPWVLLSERMLDWHPQGTWAEQTARSRAEVNAAWRGLTDEQRAALRQEAAIKEKNKTAAPAAGDA